MGEWLVQTTYHDDHKNTQLSNAERMMLSGHSLAECFKQMGQEQLELDVLIKVHNQLTYIEKLFLKAHWLMDNYITKSLNSIRQTMKRKPNQNTHHGFNNDQLLLH